MSEGGRRRRSEKIKDDQATDLNVHLKTKKFEMKSFGRFRHPYTVLVLLSVVFCIVQIYFGSALLSTDVKPTTFIPSDNVVKEPVCVLSEDAVSAVRRAATEDCRDQIKRIDCSAQSGELYPTKLESLCPLEVNAALAGKRMGCFRDAFNARILSGASSTDKKKNCPDNCISACLGSGFPFAGVQFGVECFCGNSAPPPPTKLQDTACSKPCPGDPNLTCGGYLSMDVYQTGLELVSPPKVAPVVASSAPVGVVFLLTVNGRALSQVVRLVELLDGPGSFFLVHVDARQDYLDRELRRLTAHKINVRVTRRRFSTIWGGATLLSMLLSCLEELLAIQDWDWDFVLNLSESDYPIKPRGELFEFLSSNKDKNFVKSHGRDPAQFMKKQGLDRTFHQCDNRMWRLGKRTLPAGIQFDGGSDWICLNREFSEYAVHSVDGVMVGLRQLFNYTLLPAESFFHTALLNSRFCRSYMNNNLHLTNWKRKQGCKCQHKAVVDWCGCSPNDLLSGDWSKIVGTRPKQLFFARKFEGIVDSSLFGRIDEWVGLPQRTREDQFWQSAFHHEDSYPAQDEEFVLLTNFLCEYYLGSKTELSNYKFSKVLEVNIYKYKDRIEGFLLRFQTLNFNKLNIFEIKVDFVEEKYTDSRLQVLQGLSVGTNFDPKELLFRNYLRVIGQKSAPSLRYQVGPGPTPVSLRFGWFDPLGQLQAVHELAINTTETVENIAPDLRRPLLPGCWTLVATSQSKLIHSHSFLVLPGPEWIEPVKYSPVDDVIMLSLFVPKDSRLAMEEGLMALRSGDQVGWLTRHVPRFYQISSSCAVEASLVSGPGGIKDCSDTDWSSDKQNLSKFLLKD